MAYPEPLQLQGADNFRSLQGLPSRCGRRIGRHALMRADQLHRLTAQDWQALQQLGLRTVCDLRSAGERARYPSCLPGPTVQHLHLDLTGDGPGDPRLAALLAGAAPGQGARDMMQAIYRRLPGLLAPHLPALFALFAAGRVPVLVHCAAGKDRTGVAVAILLHALGVAPQSIIVDYLLSARRFSQLDPPHQEALGHALAHLLGEPPSEAAMDAVLDARPEYLQAALGAIDTEYGGLERYLHRFSGLDAAGLQGLRDSVLVP